MSHELMSYCQWEVRDPRNVPRLVLCSADPGVLRFRDCGEPMPIVLQQAFGLPAARVPVCWIFPPTKPSEVCHDAPAGSQPT
jgi:hypothetical protein